MGWVRGREYKQKIHVSWWSMLKKVWIMEVFPGKAIFVQIPKWSERKYITGRGRIKYKALRWVCSWIKVASMTGQQVSKGVSQKDKVKASQDSRTLKGNASQTLHSIWRSEDPEDSDSGSLGWGLRFNAFNKITADGIAAGPWTLLWVARS